MEAGYVLVEPPLDHGIDDPCGGPSENRIIHITQ
jgi:hypothetical protein